MEMRYLCVFFQRLLDYRKPEVEAFEDHYNGENQILNLEWRLPENFHPDCAFLLVNLPLGEIARNTGIIKFSQLVKNGISEREWW